MIPNGVANLQEGDYPYVPVERTISDPALNPKCPQCVDDPITGLVCEYNNIKTTATPTAFPLRHYSQSPYNHTAANFANILDTYGPVFTYLMVNSHV